MNYLPWSLLVTNTISLGLFQILAQGVLLFSTEKFMAGTIPFCVVAIFMVQRVYLQTSRQIRLIDLE